MSSQKLHAPSCAVRSLPALKPIGVAVAAVFSVSALLLAAPAAQARITKVVIDTTRSQSPTFGGYSWPGVGQYEKVVGIAYGTLDPKDPKNKVIIDINLAPKDAKGLVDYSFDFYILKPIDLSKGNNKVMYEPPNRGNKTWTTFGRINGEGGNDPGSITDSPTLANAFLMPRGYTMVWSGWDQAAGVATAASEAAFVTTITLPVAANPDGSTITGPSYEYIVSPGASYALTYPAATLDQSKATLTHRIHLDDPATVLPSSAWSYNAAGTVITLTSGPFVANDIYEFSYTAKNPTVNGVGFAAIRDFNAWLRYDSADDSGNKNPLGGYIKRIVTEVVSQPARTLNDFTYWGFNQAESGKKVFDGMMQWIGAGDGIHMNYRFSQPGRTERNRQHHLYIEGRFPFANVETSDHITGTRDSRMKRCEETHTCPLTAEIYSANEYWVKAASLLHTTPDGKKDLEDSPYARNYFISSHQHGSAGYPPTAGACQQLQNPLDSQTVQRALWVDIDQWLDGKAPPRSQVPRLDNGTFADPLNQAQVGFPHIPGVTYTGLETTRYRLNYGPTYYSNGIATYNPPIVFYPYENNPKNGPIYPSWVPKTDGDGNDIAGVRLVDVTVPTATYTGWALRSGVWANDGCESSGQYIPFPKTEAARVASGDPRLSVAERYATFDAYATAVQNALNKMVKERLFLCEDVAADEQRMYTRGVTNGVPAPAGGIPASTPVPACSPHHGDGDDGGDDDGGHDD